MLYLIGANHAQQFKSAVAQMFQESESVRTKRADFTAHVTEMIDKLDIEILAEEFSDEAKKKPTPEELEQSSWGTALAQCCWETVLEQFAKAEGLEYRSCDPDSRERGAHGIDDDEKREQFWLARIQDCKNKNVLFVCGDDHFKSFAEKLIAEGFDVKHGPRWNISQDEQRIIDYEVWAAS